jgi:hypothetical protein
MDGHSSDETASARTGRLRSWWNGLGKKEVAGLLALLSLAIAALSLTNDVFGDDAAPAPTTGAGVSSHASKVAPIPPLGADPGAGIVSASPDRPCRSDAGPQDIVDATLFVDENATRVNPTLDFDSMNGSARHKERDGRRFYWGRAGSDDDDPRSGGVRLRWHRQSAGWHECAATLPQEERGYVRTPAVANVIASEPVTIVICLWRDQPKTEKCTAALQ